MAKLITAVVMALIVRADESPDYDEKMARAIENCAGLHPEGGYVTDGELCVSKDEVLQQRSPVCNNNNPCDVNYFEGGHCISKPVLCHPGFSCDPGTGECLPASGVSCEESGRSCFSAEWNGTSGVCELTPKIADKCTREPNDRGGDRAEVDCGHAESCMIETYRTEMDGICIASYLGPEEGCAETRVGADQGCLVVTNPGRVFDDGDPCTNEEAVVCRSNDLTELQKISKNWQAESFAERVVRFLYREEAPLLFLPHELAAYAHLASAGWCDSCWHDSSWRGTFFERVIDYKRLLPASCQREDAIVWPGGCAYFVYSLVSC